jgi:NAD(P)-dependent dehydrogenase (short-subunit alcohol dehydrogenase family)
MTDALAGKVALVTGGGRGLGRAHALALAQAGAAVLVNDLGGGFKGEGADPTTAGEVVAEIEAMGGRALSDSGNVADWDAARAMVDAAVAAFGRLDIVVNNAGICRFAPTQEMTREDWDVSIGVNLTGTAALSHWAARHWQARGPEAGRAIVNTSSPAGTNPAPGSPSYCVSKAGVAALTIASAIDLAPLGVRVNAIAPMARTRMTLDVPALDDIMKPVQQGFDRVAPEHVAPLVVYLASAACRFTGRVFGIEGDDLYLFDGWSAAQHFNNGAQPWSIASLADALADIDRQDRGWMIAPSVRLPGPSPTDETLAMLAAIAV